MNSAVCPALLISALVWGAGALAEVPRAAIRIDVARGLAEVSGELRADVVNVTDRPLSELYLWLPANRLAHPPEGMDQRNAHWIYPRAFSPGGITLERVEVGGATIAPGTLRFPPVEAQGLEQGQRVLATVPLAQPLAPGARTTVVARFRTTVPPRFGRFGRARGVLTLAGGFYPQVAALGRSGWQLHGPIADQSWTVELRAPAGHHVVINGRHFRTLASGWVSLDLGEAPYLSLVVARRLRVSLVTVGGVRVEYLTPRRRYRPPAPAVRAAEPFSGDGVADATEWDYEGRALATSRAALEVLAGLGYEAPPGTVIRLVEVPLRLEMVSPVPGGALVSDRAYRVTPLEPFFRFHDLQIARALSWAVLEPTVRQEHLRDRMWVLDFLAAAATDHYAVVRTGGRGGSLRSMLRYGAFLPDIDRLMYSPLIAFRHLFLRPFRDEDPVRDEPWRLASSWPRGAVLHDKLVDLIGGEAVRGLLRTYPGSGAAMRDAVAGAAGEPMEWFFDQWLGPHPSVNYRLGRVRSERLPGGRFRHRIEVVRDGNPIREPVAVLAIDRSGQRHELRWDGRGQRGEVEVTCDAELARIVVNPATRLVEDARLSDNNPRLDNISPARFRPPVFNGLWVTWSAAEGALYAGADFSVLRRFDARNAVRLRLDYGPRGFGADMYYKIGLGPLLDLNRASWVVMPGLSVLRTVGGFATREEEATFFSGGVVLSHDTRWYPFDPMEGWGVSMSVSGGGAVTDQGEWAWAVSTGARAAGHWTPRVGHSFTGWAGAGLLYGDPFEEHLQSVSGRFMLRAFEADETLGRVRLYAGVEYRWTALHDLDLNLAHIARLRAIFLVAFAAGATASRPDSYGGLFTEERGFSEVGAGLRALFEIAGVVPYLIAVDVAYPITPRDRLACRTGNDGAELCFPRQPVGVYISLQHTM